MIVGDVWGDCSFLFLRERRKDRYRLHNADKSKRGLLNILPRTILGFPSEGKARLGSCRAARRANRFGPEHGNFFRCAHHLCCLAPPGLPGPRGVSGGGAALSSLCRRFPGGDIMNLTSRRNPLSGLSFTEFFILRERKTGWLSRWRKISVAKAKPDSEPSPPRVRWRRVPTNEV